MVRYVWLFVFFISVALSQSNNDFDVGDRPANVVPKKDRKKAADEPGISIFNYCTDSRCQRKHTGCIYADLAEPSLFAKACPKDAREMRVARYKKYLLSAHNQVRNVLAKGHGDLSQAARMGEVVWSNELEHLAKISAKTCSGKRDRCFDTQDYSHPGQNMRVYRYRGHRIPGDGHIIQNAMNSWVGEVQNLSQTVVDLFPKEKEREISRVATIINEKNTRLGCAGVRFRQHESTKAIFICNYAQANVIGHHIYSSGPVGSQCSSGPSSNLTLDGLCSVNEPYNWHEL